MGFVGVGTSSPTSVRMQTSCASLLTELQHIWSEIGETEADKDCMLLQLEMECLEIYKRKVDEANNAKACLHQSVAAKEAELAALSASLGEHILHSQKEKNLASLKQQLASVTPLLEDLRVKKEERVKQFAEIKSQIERITSEIAGYSYSSNTVINQKKAEETDFSLRKLNEYQAQLQSLQKEKSDRLHKVLEYVNEVHSLCGVLGMDFGKTVDEVHPSLHEADTGQTTNVSNSTLEGLSQTILKLKTEKKARFQKLRDIVTSLFELWNLMDTSVEERRPFRRVTCVLGSPEHDITDFGVLSPETIEQATAEVERLTKLKASRMKELVFKRWLELEEICRLAHIEPDMTTAPEKSNALIDSGIMDPLELVTNIEAQIVKAKEESNSRKEIMDRISKWLTACEEENWLEQYNQDGKRYSAGRGAHLNLKRAERARVTVTKMPGIVDNLMHRTIAWEGERNKPFLYDGVRLVSILEEYKLARQQREEEKRQYRDMKKLQDLLVTEKEAMYGSKPSPRRNQSLDRKANGYHRNGNGSMTTMPSTPRRHSAGIATPELLTSRSYVGRQNGYFKETRRMSNALTNNMYLSKDDTMSSFASICSSESGTPPWSTMRK